MTQDDLLYALGAAIDRAREAKRNTCDCGAPLHGMNAKSTDAPAPKFADPITTDLEGTAS